MISPAASAQSRKRISAVPESKPPVMPTFRLSKLPSMGGQGALGSSIAFDTFPDEANAFADMLTTSMWWNSDSTSSERSGRL
jgi:hypothetical protein